MTYYSETKIENEMRREKKGFGDAVKSSRRLENKFKS